MDETNKKTKSPLHEAGKLRLFRLEYHEWQNAGFITTQCLKLCLLDLMQVRLPASAH